MAWPAFIFKSLSHIYCFLLAIGRSWSLKSTVASLVLRKIGIHFNMDLFAAVRLLVFWKRNCSFLYESVLVFFLLFCYEFKEFLKEESKKALTPNEYDKTEQKKLNKKPRYCIIMDKQMYHH